jgi:hypothetical protein
MSIGVMERRRCNEWLPAGFCEWTELVGKQDVAGTSPGAMCP